MLFKKMYIILRQKHIEDKIPDITNLANNTTCGAKINQVKRKIPSITTQLLRLLLLLWKIKYLM